MTGGHVAVVGTGYVGSVTAACLAKLGHTVRGFDSDGTRAAQLDAGQVPFFEPGLAELLREVLADGQLTFTSDPVEALADAGVVFLCVGTPTGRGGSPDLSQVESAARTLAPLLAPDVVVVNKSTVPVGAGNWLRAVLQDALPPSEAPRFHVVSNPEFLREGSAIADFLHPDRIVLGGDDEGVDRVAALYRPVLEQEFPGGWRELRPRLVTTDLASAEMIKYAANAFLATKISFANEVANLCELVGADAREVLPAIGADSRIGNAFLSPGVGWGGSCFGKDVTALIATAAEYGYSADLLGAAKNLNGRQRDAVIRKLQRELKVLKGRRVALLGLAFKPGTDDLRDAPALTIARRLLDAGAVVTAYDPVVKQLPDDLAAVRVCSDAYESATRADAVLLVTEWPEFGLLEPARLRSCMAGTLVLDGRNTLAESDYAAAGLRLLGFGW